MRTEVFLDMDGVITDFQQGCCDFYKILNPYDNPNNLGKYEISDLIGIPRDMFYAGMNQQFWANLKWTPHGKQILVEILRYVDEKQVTLLTAPLRTAGCMEGKVDWIRSNMQRWSRRFLMGPAKWAIAAPGKLLIDDCEDNVDNWITHPDSKLPTGGHAILVPLRSNKLHKLDPVEWVRCRLKEYFDA